LVQQERRKQQRRHGQQESPESLEDDVKNNSSNIADSGDAACKRSPTALKRAASRAKQNDDKVILISLLHFFDQF